MHVQLLLARGLPRAPQEGDELLADGSLVRVGEDVLHLVVGRCDDAVQDLRGVVVAELDALDGVVRAITADSLVCLQDVNDPLSLTKQREVRMTLRAVTEAK